MLSFSIVIIIISLDKFYRFHYRSERLDMMGVSTAKPKRDSDRMLLA